MNSFVLAQRRKQQLYQTKQQQKQQEEQQQQKQQEQQQQQKQQEEQQQQQKQQEEQQQPRQQEQHPRQQQQHPRQQEKQQQQHQQHLQQIFQQYQEQQYQQQQQHNSILNQILAQQTEILNTIRTTNMKLDENAKQIQQLMQQKTTYVQSIDQSNLFTEPLQSTMVQCNSASNIPIDTDITNIIDLLDSQDTNINLVAPTTQTTSRKRSDHHENIAQTAFKMICNSFTVDVLKKATITGRNNCECFDKQTIETIKHKVLIQYGASMLDWDLSFERIQSLLREKRKKLKKV